MARIRAHAVGVFTLLAAVAAGLDAQQGTPQQIRAQTQNAKQDVPAFRSRRRSLANAVPGGVSRR